MPQKTKVLVNNKRVDMITQPISFVLNSAIEHFKQESMVLETTGIDSLANLSVDALFAMGITQITRMNVDLTTDFGLNFDDDFGIELTSEFSFMSLENKDEGIDNINIVDPDIGMLSPELIGTKDKFIAVDDPFYEQDDEKIDIEKAIIQKRKSQKSKGLIKIASDMCQPHLSKEVKNQNRHFTDYNINKRRGKMS